MKKITAFVIDTVRNTAEVKELDDDIHAYYKELNCDCFDIARRKIGGRVYCILCDDIGLYKENPIISAIEPIKQEDVLVGNLVIVAERNHEFESLTAADIMRIHTHICTYKDGNVERDAVAIG